MLATVWLLLGGTGLLLLAAVRAAWRGRAARRCRHAWTLVALAAAAHGAALGLAGPAWSEPAAVPLPVTVLEVTSTVLLATGLLVRSDPLGSSRLRWVVRLDLATVAVGSGALVTLAVLGGTGLPHGTDPVRAAAALSFPLGALLAVLATVAGALRGASGPAGPVLTAGPAGPVLIGGPAGPSVAGRPSRRVLAALAAGALEQLVAGALVASARVHAGAPVVVALPLELAGLLTLVVAGVLEGAGAPGGVGGRAAGLPAPAAPSGVPRPVMMAPGAAFVALFLANHRGGTGAALVVAAVAATVAARQRLLHSVLAGETAERAALAERLRHHVFHDPLTGLANRALVEERLTHALARRAAPGTGHGVVVLDVGGLVQARDTLGSAVGDELLRVVAERLRSVAGRADTVARVGGDRFAVLVEDVADEDAATALARLALERVTAPALVDGHLLAPAAAAGVALSDEGGSSGPSELVRQAETAVLEAKRSPAGGERLRVFHSAMRGALVDQLELEVDLRVAQQRGELRVVYQPIVELASCRPIGFEALVRWQHPRRGQLAPAAFLPLAERAGLLEDLDAWVLAQACARAAAWNAERPATSPLSVHVNLSPVELAGPGLRPLVEGTLAATGLPPGALVLELVESAVVADLAAASARLSAVRALGVRIAADDFGTGYSTLSHLHVLPLDILKLDRSFVSAMHRSTQASALVHAVVQLGASLGLDTVAEGIEEERQVERLRHEACGFGQGYLFARPLDEPALAAYLRADLPTVPHGGSPRAGSSLGV